MCGRTVKSPRLPFKTPPSSKASHSYSSGTFIYATGAADVKGVGWGGHSQKNKTLAVSLHQQAFLEADAYMPACPHCRSPFCSNAAEQIDGTRQLSMERHHQVIFQVFQEKNTHTKKEPNDHERTIWAKPKMSLIYVLKGHYFKNVMRLVLVCWIKSCALTSPHALLSLTVSPPISPEPRKMFMQRAVTGARRPA